MKRIIIFAACCYLFSGCTIFRRQEYGCPTNGKNIGAEKILSGDKAAIKAAKRAKKFKN